MSVKKPFLCLAAAFFWCLSSSAGASVAERQRIAALDLSRKEDLAALDGYIASGNTLAYAKARERLILMPQEALRAVKERVQGTPSLASLARLVDKVIGGQEQEGLFRLQEELLVDNVPAPVDAPFYDGASPERRIISLDPSAEHLYFNNLKLSYRTNSLRKIADDLWAGPKKAGTGGIGRVPPRLNAQETPFSSGGLLPEAARMWIYRLRDDNLTDYLVSLRQWVKRYEEPPVFPLVYGDAVIIRNAYRVYALDLSSGRGFMSFGSPAGNSQEFYQVLRHPHHGAGSYHMALWNDTLFTELDARLAAVNIQDLSNPRLLWERDLGEYSVCSGPAMHGNRLTVGLANARGECWVLGFDPADGSLAWSTYIGISSFLSPAAGLSASSGDLLFMATNRGFLACLSLRDGSIRWIRKYAPRKYDLFDYWQQVHSPEANLIGFDTQFLNPEADRLYYKPRESDYLYIVDAGTGELRERVLIDPEEHYLLGAHEGRAIFLARARADAQKDRIRVIDLESGDQIEALDVKPGSLKGVWYPGSNEIAYKAADTVHFLKLDAHAMEHREVGGLPPEDWLLGVSGSSLFLGNGRTVSCVGIAAKSPETARNNASRLQRLEKADEILAGLGQALRLSGESEETARLIGRLTAAIGLPDIPLSAGELLPLVAGNLEALRLPAWKGFILKLKERYGKDIVTYNDVELIFKNFLSGAGLIGRPEAPDTRAVEAGKGPPAGRPTDFRAQGERLFLLPVQVIGERTAPDFFLLLNRDQLLCVDEAGGIRWHRKVFYRSYPTVNYNVQYATDRVRGRMYADDIEAYLCGGVLIVNDRINIIAFDAGSGAYLWSMTNTGDTFEEGKRYPPRTMDRLYTQYGMDRSFLKNIMFSAAFLGDKIVIVHGRTVYSVDPRTGYCGARRTLDIEGAVSVAASDTEVYIASYFLDRLKVLDERLGPAGDIPLGFIEDKETFLEIIFAGRFAVLRTPSAAYALDRKAGFALKHVIPLSASDACQVQSLGDDLLVVEPFQGMTCYRLSGDTAETAWEVDKGLAGEEAMWKFRERATRYYFVLDDQIIFPFRKEGDLFLVSIDRATGAERWEKRLEGIKGLFYDLSNCVTQAGMLNFVLTTGCEEIYTNKPEDFAGAESIFFSSKICAVDLASGELVRKDKMRSLSVERIIERSNLAETGRYIVYMINSKFLIAERKRL